MINLPPIPEDSVAAQRTEESAKHYEWFLSYLSLSPPRTVARTASDVDRAYGTVRRVAGRHEWRHRAQVWDWEQRAQFAVVLRGITDGIAGSTAEAARAHASNLRSAALDLDPSKIPPREIAPGIKHMSDVTGDLGSYATEVEESARPVDAEQEERARQDPRAAGTEALADFVVHARGRPSEQVQAARALLSNSSPREDEGSEELAGAWREFLEQLPEEHQARAADLLMRGRDASS